jgi:hypothetical protein
MSLVLSQSFDQAVLATPIIPHEVSQVSTLAAGEGQTMTAKAYHWDIESLARLSIRRDIPIKRWVSGDIGAFTGTVAFSTRGSLNAFASLPDPINGWTITPARTSREIVSYTQAITQALEAEQLSSARNIFQAMPPWLTRDPRLSSLGQVLALPVVHLSTKRDTDRSQEYDWLRTEGHKYSGQWVAVEGSQLLATAPTLRELRNQLRTLHHNRTPLVHRIV